MIPQPSPLVGRTSPKARSCVASGGVKAPTFQLILRKVDRGSVAPK